MKSINYKKNLKTKIRENPDENWDIFVTKFSKSLRNSVKIRIENLEVLFIFVVYGKPYESIYENSYYYNLETLYK